MKKYIYKEFENRDTPKQFLSKKQRYVIAKKPKYWTENQEKRVRIRFKEYPLLKKAYPVVLEFRNIYEQQNIKHK